MSNVVEQGKLFLGLNYWGSESSINMWSDWNPVSIENDLEKIAKAKISVIRVFPLWSEFQPVKALYMNDGNVYDYRCGEEVFPDTEAGKAGVSENACEKFEEFCNMAAKHGIKLIVGLLTGHMSFRFYSPQAFEGKNFLSDPTTIKWEIRFVKYFVNRFKKFDSIIGWDLGNECGCMAHTPGFNPDSAYLWVSAIANTIKLADPSRPVITGLDESPIEKGPFNLLEIGEQLDMQTVHPYNIFQTDIDPLISMRSILDSSFRCQLYTDIAKKPTFVQEVGSIGYMNCSEKSEADFYRALLFSTWADDCLGVMWWCAFDQGHLEYAPYDWNNIGSNYGFFRKDGSEKPIVKENVKFQKMMENLPFDKLPKKISDAVCIIPNENGAKTVDVLRATYCLAKQANMELSFVHASEPVPEAKIYIMPSIDSNRAITKHRYQELLEKVSEGASLYMSYGSALFRNFDELSGLIVSSREGYSGSAIMHMDGKDFEFKNIDKVYQYNIEACESEVLGETSENPVFVKKQYGKGEIYTLLYPIEKMLSGQVGAFHNEEMAQYDLIYRKFAGKGSKHIADTDSRFIRITEHPVDDKTRYIVAVNYSGEDRIANLTLDPSWNVSEVFTGQYENGVLSVPACDGVIIKVVGGNGSNNGCL